MKFYHNNIVSYVVSAGGGGGGKNAGGGGGGGGFREYKGPSDCYTASPLNGNPGRNSNYSYSTGLSNYSWWWWSWWGVQVTNAVQAGVTSTFSTV